MDNLKIDIANELGPKTARWGMEAIVYSAIKYNPDSVDPADMTAEEYDAKALLLVRKGDIRPQTFRGGE